MNGRLRFSLIGETKAVKYKVSCGTQVSHVARRDEMQSDIRLWGWTRAWRFSVSLSREGWRAQWCGWGGSVPREDKGPRRNEGGGRGKMRVQCTARSASRGIMLPYLPITKPLLRWVPPSMNRTDTLDMPWHGHRLRRLHSQPPRTRVLETHAIYLFKDRGRHALRSCLSFSRVARVIFSSARYGVRILCWREYLEFGGYDDNISVGF